MRSRLSRCLAAFAGFSALAALAPCAAWSQTTPDASTAPGAAADAAPASPASNPAITVVPPPATPPAPPPQGYGPGDSGSQVSSGTATEPSAPAKGPHYRRFSIGPEIGLYVPTSSKARDRFGSGWFSIGLGIGDIVPPRHGGDVTLDLNFISQTTRSDRHAYLIPIGVQYRQALNPRQVIDSNSAVVPYIGVSADLVLADVRSPRDGAHSGIRETGGGSVFIGTSLTTRAYIEARYIAVGTTEHFDLSGFNFTAGYRF